LDNPEVVTCPDASEAGLENPSYLWRADLPPPSDPPDAPIGADKAGYHRGGRNVLFNDGSVKWVREEVFQREIAPLLGPE
jgi:prepilin-type processing-associated H-X9-DG protein